jgi:hypothetical protein
MVTRDGRQSMLQFGRIGRLRCLLGLQVGSCGRWRTRADALLAGETGLACQVSEQG